MVLMLRAVLGFTVANMILTGILIYIALRIIESHGGDSDGNHR